MTPTLLDIVRERIHAGLQRKSIMTASDWALQYRVMGPPYPGAWTFDHHPWLKGMHNANDYMVIGQKSAQMGYTEFGLNKAFKAIDIDGYNVLYVLPVLQPDASDFSKSRFDPALELSPHLHNLFSDVKNIGHKRAGTANLFIRGSRSRSQMKSLPINIIIFDEVDEMCQENIPLALERMSGQLEKQAILISTPTAEGIGINKYFKLSTEDHFFFKCPSCSKFTELIYPDCIVITAESLTDPRLPETHLICKECKTQLVHELKYEWLKDGEWVSSYKDRNSRGFYVNQMYSPTVHPVELAVSYLKAQYNPADEQEFFNSKMGMPNTPEGARVTDEHLQNCLSNYKRRENSTPSKLVTMGIDVGKWLHYSIEEWSFDGDGLGNDINLLASPSVVTFGKLRNFEEIDKLIWQYNVNFFVIDAQPERRKSKELCQRFAGMSRSCIYAPGLSGKNINDRPDEYEFTCDRTSWLDLALGRYKNQKIRLPFDIDKEYKDHLKALIRITKYDSQGNIIGLYMKDENEPDHYAHARNYAELAFKFAASLAANLDVTEKPW